MEIPDFRFGSIAAMYYSLKNEKIPNK